MAHNIKKRTRKRKFEEEDENQTKITSIFKSITTTTNPPRKKLKQIFKINKEIDIPEELNQINQNQNHNHNQNQNNILNSNDKRNQNI